MCIKHCMCIYTHAYIRAHIHIHTCTCIDVYKQHKQTASMYVDNLMCMHDDAYKAEVGINMQKPMYIWLYILMHMHTCTYKNTSISAHAMQTFISEHNEHFHDTRAPKKNIFHTQKLTKNVIAPFRV